MMDDIGPGDIVVCVNASNLEPMFQLAEGASYRIREIDPLSVSLLDGKEGVGILLVGIYNPEPEIGQDDVAYSLSRFRPINESDSEIFREMIKIKEDA